MTHPAPLARGQVWRYAPKGSPRERAVLLVGSADVLNSTRRTLPALDIEAGDPRDVLAAAVTVHGARRYVQGHRVNRILRSWLVEPIDQITASELAYVDLVLAAALGLEL